MGTEAFPPVDYQAVLADLRAKRDKLADSFVSLGQIQTDPLPARASPCSSRLWLSEVQRDERFRPFPDHVELTGGHVHPGRLLAHRTILGVIHDQHPLLLLWCDAN